MIYAIVSVKSDPGKLTDFLSGMTGIGGAGLYAVNFVEISAVACDIKRADIIADQLNAIEYARVVETLSQQFTLLPVRFGSIMESSDAISKMVERNYHDIQLNLEKVENKLEFGLKVICDSEKLRAEMSAKSEATSKIETNSDPGIKNSASRDWVNKKLKEHRVEELLLGYVDSVIAKIAEYLTRLNADKKFKKMVTPTTIIDAVFLLEKDKKDELIQTVKELQDSHANLAFVLTGPWPPYSFVDFTVK